MIINAILKINPKAEVVVRGTNINTCEIEWLNGTNPISKSQIEAMIPIVEKEIADKELQEKNNKQSALNKLKTLGLTDAEIKALIS